jgi:hypothetical protein
MIFRINTYFLMADVNGDGKADLQQVPWGVQAIHLLKDILK